MTGAGGTDIHERVLRVERAATVVLRIGVVASLTVIVAGMALSILHHPREFFSRGELARFVSPGAAFPYTIADVVQGIAALQGRAVMTAGLILLLFLPVVRVVLTGLIFVIQKDRVFMLITLGVLALLVLSLVLGRAG